MDPDDPSPSTRASPSIKWSLYAGGYAFLCGVVLLLPLGFVADTLVEILGLPPGFTAAFVPGTGGIIGAVAWWALVERPGAYTYLVAGAVGLVTALSTVAFWTLVLATVWGPRFVLLGGVVIAFVLVVGPLSLVAGVPMMYARRRHSPAT